MNVYQIIIKEKSDCEIDLDKVIWIAVPDDIELVLTDDAIAAEEYKLLNMNLPTAIPGTDIIATLIE